LRPATGTLLLLLPLTALAGCGSTTIDSGKAQSFLNGAIQPTPKTVKCPSGIQAKKGRSFDCSVVAVNGLRYRVTLHIIDDSGHVKVGPADVHPAH